MREVQLDSAEVSRGSPSDAAITTDVGSTFLGAGIRATATTGLFSSTGLHETVVWMKLDHYRVSWLALLVAGYAETVAMIMV
jgi:hypothetical protein